MQTLIFGWLLASSLYAATRILQAIRIASWQDCTGPLQLRCLQRH